VIDLRSLKLKSLPFGGYRKKDGPDTTGVNQAAAQSAQTSADALAWYKQ